MCTSQVKKLHAQTGLKVHVHGNGGKQSWSEVFEHNPKIERLRSRDVVLLRNGSGCRPYIQAKTAERWHFKPWDISPGEIFLTNGERDFGQQAKGKILVEPWTKVPGGNKAWLTERWQELVDRNPGQYVQVGPAGTMILGGVGHIVTPTFRHALAVLSACRGFVGPEGGLHHGAAALDIPAVTLWSEFIHPRFTGYDSQVNIRHAGEYCGSRLYCQGCKDSMAAISVDEVHESMTKIL